jgi:hypothetical protein
MEKGTSLRLRAEMKLPGRAWLEFRIQPTPEGTSTLHQRAVFFPHGLGGRLYWLAVMPLHGIVFAGMANAMAKKAEGLGATRVA